MRNMIVVDRRKCSSCADAVVVVVQPHTGHIDVAWQEGKLVMPPWATALLASLENGDETLDLERAARQASARRGHRISQLVHVTWTSWEILCAIVPHQLHVDDRLMPHLCPRNSLKAYLILGYL